MNATPAGLLGRLAVHYKMISTEQLSGALQVHSRSPHKQLGMILVELGLISKAQLGQLLKAQEQYLARDKPQASRKPAAPEASVPPKVPPPPPKPAVQPPITPARPAAAAGASTHATPLAREKRDPARVTWLHRVLTHAVATRATDVHLHANTPVKLRVRGQLVSMSKDVLSADNASATLRASLTDEQLDALDSSGEVEFGYEVPNVGRFRASVYQQHDGLCAVYHYIPAEPPDLLQLGLPTVLARLTNHRNGLLIVSGPAGSGKTSTMAALIALMNEERDDHILSLEDPIEYLHTSKRCIVNQREVGRHTQSFRSALQSALREDPDIICIGELRDHETISLALSAAETGHLVIGTMHTLGGVRTVNRIIGSYPTGQQGQVRAMLSESLRGVISQRLVPAADGQRMLLAYELLIINQAAANLIREQRTFQLASVLQTGRAQGMRAMDESLMELVRSGDITRDAAREHADNPNQFR